MTTSIEQQVHQIARDAQQRGGVAGRRADGAFFTDADVAEHLARRAITSWLLDRIGSMDEAGAAARMAELLPTISVLDPTCGAGSFLAAAWRVLDELAAAFGVDGVSPRQLHGVDYSPEAVEACLATFALIAPQHDAPRIVLGDALAPDMLEPADVVLGNPPYVRASATDAQRDLATATVPNVSAWVVERALAVARPGARVAFVLPISTSCTDAFAAARDEWEHTCDIVATSHFDTIPSSLFEGVVQRLSIYEARRRGDHVAASVQPAHWYTSRYHRWTSDERVGLLDRVVHVPLPAQHVSGSIAKIGASVEASLLARMFEHPPAGRWFVGGAGDRSGNRVLYKRRWSYFLLFSDFVPEIWGADGKLREPSELKVIHVAPALDARVLIAVYSSTLFWWYFSVFTDNRNVNRRDLAAFPLPDLDHATTTRLAQLGRKLMDALRACAEVRTCTYRSIGTIRNTYFRQAATRPVIDEIDQVLADAYAMTDDELAFVLGYEHRFRS